MSEASEKLLVALGESCRQSDRWRITAFDRADGGVECLASFDGPDLPGGCGVRCTMEPWGTRWAVRPDSSSMSNEQAPFWTALSERLDSPFSGFMIETAELLSLLSPSTTEELFEGLRKRAARRERRAFQNDRDGKKLRAIIGDSDDDFVCPVRCGTHEYASLSGELRVRYSISPANPDMPARVWLLVRVWPGGREILAGEWPQWWPTRRSADDEARRVLARLNTHD